MLQALEINILGIFGSRLNDDLILVIMLEPVGLSP